LQWYSALVDRKNLAVREYLDKIRESVSMFDRELREEEADGKDSAMDCDCELDSAFKGIDSSEFLLISIAMNTPGGQFPLQEESSEDNMPRDSTPGVLFLLFGRCIT
jgi:hypothetical protein